VGGFLEAVIAVLAAFGAVCAVLCILERRGDDGAVDNELDMLYGTIASVVYTNETNGYSVLTVETEEAGKVTVVGTAPGCAPGETIEAWGRWVTHPVHGEQFNAERVERSLPATAAAMLSYLSSGAVKGVGPVTAGRIVERFGADTFEVMEQDPRRLKEIRGITEKKALEIGRAFRELAGIRRIMEFLAIYNVQPHVAVRLHRDFGDEAVSVLREDPYLLAREDYGVGFPTADAMALDLGFEPDSGPRVRAAVLFEMQHNLGNGHTFLPRNKLVPATASMLDTGIDPVEKAMDDLAAGEEIVIEELAGLQACYLRELYEAEVFVARRIRELAGGKASAPRGVERLIDRTEELTGIRYAPLQREAVRMAAERRLFVLTGGPGTGKSTTVRGILALFKAMELETVLAAPTGRSAKRLTELSGAEAATIHRLLEAGYDRETGLMRFAKDEDDPLRADAVIVDECSMVDLQLMQSLLAAMKPGCRLVLVGDADQLPSVGAGNVFGDIIRGCEDCTVRLTDIFRQAQESDIVVNAHKINAGILPDLSKKDADFFFLRRRDPVRTVETIVELCESRLPQRMGIAPESIQVLSPGRKGRTGVLNLNRELQNALNPASKDKNEKKFREFVFREGDRVMQIKNNYDIIWKSERTGQEGTGVFNGDVGLIRTVDTAEDLVYVEYDDKTVAYTNDMLEELEPAFAVTVHKAQGSEYPAVVLAVSEVPMPLRAREILYTAVTRAKELFILVGDDEIIRQMTENFKQKKRYSGLKIRLTRS